MSEATRRAALPNPAELSPARFHTGAFRLALDVGAPVVPVAIAGFHRRFKDGPLVAIVCSPLDVAEVMKTQMLASVREFADWLRATLAKEVAAAGEIAGAAPQLPDTAG